MFDPRPIRTDADHAAALAEMARLWGAPAGSPESERLEVLATLAGAFEDETSPIEPPDPIEVLMFYIDQGRLTEADLVRIAGSRARAGDILARRRRLTLGMVWRLHAGFGLPLETLARPYDLAAALVRRRTA